MKNIDHTRPIVRAPLREAYAAFDALPPQLRAWLRNAPANYSSIITAKILREERGNVAKTIRRLSSAVTKAAPAPATVADLF